MKFPVGTKVVITNSFSIKEWNGVRAVVKEYDHEENTYPYNLTLTDGTPNGSFKPGETAEAFREDELTLAADVEAEDVAKAIALLQKHGIAFRIYTREDVDKMLDAYAQDDNDPVDTRTFREELVEFIMNGQDWKDLSRKGFDDESTLWNLVEGVRNDHPEWFVS